MGEIKKPKKVKLITSIIYKDTQYLNHALKILKRIYGPLEDLEKDLAFDHTDYYYEEFGKPLRRQFICFKKLVSIEGVYKIKLRTNRIEDFFRINGKRCVNIDPGYVTSAKLILLTTKDYTHRVYLAKGIFAESTLFFENGTFKAWPWTYPDYASKETISYFNDIRRLTVGTHLL